MPRCSSQSYVKNKFTFRANLKIKKDDYLSDKDTFEVVKLLGFLERAKRHIINHLDLNDIYEENEDEMITPFGGVSNFG